MHVDQPLSSLATSTAVMSHLGSFSRLRRAGQGSPGNILHFSGDLYRGPSSLAALSLWAAPSLEQSLARVHRLAGNHEQLLMLSIGSLSVA